MTPPVKHYVTVDAVIVVNDQIVLIQRQNEPFKGMWALPGGFVDENECVIDACKREAKEETNLSIIPSTIVGVYSEPNRDPRGHIISIAFTCLLWNDGYELKAGDDAKNVRWFQLKQLPPLAFDHAKIIKDWSEL